jgi:hypothetical protein
MDMVDVIDAVDAVDAVDVIDAVVSILRRVFCVLAMLIRLCSSACAHQPVISVIVNSIMPYHSEPI